VQNCASFDNLCGEILENRFLILTRGSGNLLDDKKINSPIQTIQHFKMLFNKLVVEF
jgi:hypothetical protein